MNPIQKNNITSNIPTVNKTSRATNTQSKDAIVESLGNLCKSYDLDQLK